MRSVLRDLLALTTMMFCLGDRWLENFKEIK
jgi:hypothetical protein